MAFFAEPGPARVIYEEETVRRLRPFARRRLSTRRPFFVAMRTRNPCVRLRRRRFGWKVTLIVGSPCGEIYQRRNLDSNQAARRLSIIRAAVAAVVGRPNRVLQSRPLRKVVGAPPEVFHNCGKKCGKATVFAPLLALEGVVTRVSTGRRPLDGPFSWFQRVPTRKRAVTTRSPRGESGADGRLAGVRSGKHRREHDWRHLGPGPRSH